MWNGANQRNLERKRSDEVRKGRSNSHAAAPTQAARSRPTPIQRTGRMRRRVSDPDRSARHVLQDEGNGHGDAGDKSPAGQIVPTQKQKHGCHA